MRNYEELNCLACAYCSIHPIEKDQGECRRRAPVPKNVDESVYERKNRPSIQPYWPTVYDGDWCGEWRPRNKTEGGAK